VLVFKNRMLLILLTLADWPSRSHSPSRFRL